MKKLLKYLSPFAPDISGVVSVLFGMKGITVICDAGGCTGNVCGFDEPRWEVEKSAIFSAGLRDMDAILGRDEKMVEKIAKATNFIQGDMVGIVGTVVPAVIATDFKALKRMTEKKVSVPVVSIPATGTRYYDKGVEAAYMELFKTLIPKTVCDDTVIPGSIGILGATPLDTSLVDFYTPLQDKLSKQGYEKIYCYGVEGADGVSAVEVVEKAHLMEENLVISPAGIKPARYLKEKYNIPYKVAYPLIRDEFISQVERIILDTSPQNDSKKTKVLIIHQQVAANEIRNIINMSNDINAKEIEIAVGSFFGMESELMEEQDVFFTGEDDYVEYIEKSDFDIIIGDELLKRPVREYESKFNFIHIPQFAVSGKLEDKN